MIARLALQIAPRARATTVVGRHGDAIKIHVAAPPERGAANAELVRFLARRLGVARAAVTIVGGVHARRKTVEVAGVETGAAVRALLPGGPA